jgi:hypothetical protein
MYSRGEFKNLITLENEPKCALKYQKVQKLFILGTLLKIGEGGMNHGTA